MLVAARFLTLFIAQERESSVLARAEQALQSITRRVQAPVGTQPLRLYCAGGAGTGKSHVLSACTDFMSAWGKADWFRTAAFTNSAAFSVGGATIHNVIGANITNVTETPLPTDDNRQCAIESLSGVRFLFIDEISMVSCVLLACVSRRMNVANAMPVDPDPAATSTALTFGGQNIVCFGDFAQYRPVKQAWLGSTAAMPCAARQDTGRNTPKKRKLAADYLAFMTRIDDLAQATWRSLSS
jgi:hypothetical protein